MMDFVGGVLLEWHGRMMEGAKLLGREGEVAGLSKDIWDVIEL